MQLKNILRLLASKYIDKVVINTDSKQIKSGAKNSFGEKVLIIDRPENIKGDYVSMNNIIDYDIQMLDSYAHFLQTHSTNPLLKTETIDNAIEKYFKVIGIKIY